MKRISSPACALGGEARALLYCVGSFFFCVVRVPAADLGPALDACPGVAKFMDELASRQMTRATQERPTVPTEDALRRQILAMEKEDQAARNPRAITADSEQARAAIRVVSDRHLPILKTIAATHGFPTIGQIGRDGVDAFWLLIQHADGDASFQAAMLDAIRPRIAAGEIDLSKVALLTDRVLMAQGKPQRFGTQTRAVNGKHVAYASEDEKNLIARRDAMGLMPLGDYLCMLDALYRPDEHSDP
jgi:hypothetical protein